MSSRHQQSSPRTWRALQQEMASTPHGRGAQRKRRMKGLFKVFAGLSCLLLLAAVLFGVFHLIDSREGSLTLAGPAEPIQEIQFSTNGVLDGRWLQRQLGLRRGTTLMEVDIFSLRQRLESVGQVERANIKRIFPHTLQVTLSEFQPVLRMVAMDTDGTRKVLFINEDGVVFEGMNFSPEQLAQLPFVTGLQLRREGESYSRLRGILEIVEFIEFAKDYYPEIYRGWRYLSLQDYDPRPGAPLSRIRAVSRHTPEMIFAVRDYPEQFRKLNFVLEYIADNGSPPPRRIDLSVDQFTAVLPSSNL